MKYFNSFDKLLFLFFAFIGTMIAFRIYFTGSPYYLSLAWNIFLGWIPYVLSNYFTYVQKKQTWKKLFLFASWLLFFPNALYIVTDLIHLQEASAMPAWYDAVLLFASSFVGILLAFVSLRRAERFLRKYFRPLSVTLSVPLILFLSSFGVYLGRFDRWNSWDVINNPLALGLNIFSYISSPIDNVRTWAITVIFTAIYSLLYFSMKILPLAISENKNTGR
ncbi:MAG: hypothetical protein JWQ27_981 [Ferruginibacter sp.]|nr:hypothetical protein [Ferruginibacter sp.]